MKILITGIKGVVGTCLKRILEEQGHDVYGLDLFHSIDKKYERVDIGEYRQLERFFTKYGPFDFVYNCAAEFGRWNGEDYYEQLWHSNAIGTKNVIRLQEKLKFKLVHFSSSEVYGDYDELMKESVMEKKAIHQMNDYAMTKWVNEMQIKNSALQFKTETVIVRLFNTYGPGEMFHPYRSVNARFCYSALHKLPITVHVGHIRTSTYLDDACRTLSNIVKNFKPGEVYNISGGVRHSVEEMVDIIYNYTNAYPGLITYDSAEPMTTKVKLVSNVKSETDLGHKDTVTLKEGIINTIEWLKKQS